MALLSDEAVCPLCQESLERPNLATSGCAFPQDHRLWRFCDTPIHIDCLQDWADRQEFCSAYHKQRLEQYSREGWPILAAGDGWFCGKPLPYPGAFFTAADADLIEIRVEDWPINFIAQMTTWDAFLAGSWRTIRPDLHSYALARAEVVIAELSRQISDTNSLFTFVDQALNRLRR